MRGQPRFRQCLRRWAGTRPLSAKRASNGVAILAREPLDVRQTRLPGLSDEDAQARYVEVEFAGLRVGNLYLPERQFQWRCRLCLQAALDGCTGSACGRLCWTTMSLWCVAGDYNVCPEDVDFAAGVLAPEDALLRPETRARYFPPRVERPDPMPYAP